MEQPKFIKQQALEFRKIYRSWFKDLSDNFPESKKTVVKYYKDHMNNDYEDILKLFFKNASQYFEILSEQDYSFFDNCGSFYSDIEYNKIMASEKGLTEEYRNSEMIYLNKLCYMTILLLDVTKRDNGETQLEELEKYTPLLIKFLTNIQTLDGTNMENLMKQFESAFSPEKFNEADKAFIHDNPLLSELAEEISKEIKIPESFKNIQKPQDIFKMMFNKEGKDFMEEMVKSVGGKIQNKIKSGELDEKDLFNQAQQMMGTVFNNNPMFSAMGGMPGMAHMGALARGEQEKEDEEETENKKEDLRKKLKEKLKSKRI
jgi:hypothetical protein